MVPAAVPAALSNRKRGRPSYRCGSCKKARIKCVETCEGRVALEQAAAAAALVMPDPGSAGQAPVAVQQAASSAEGGASIALGAAPQVCCPLDWIGPHPARALATSAACHGPRPACGLAFLLGALEFASRCRMLLRLPGLQLAWPHRTHLLPWHPTQT